MKIKTDTIVRTIVLIIALINQALSISGHSVLPFSDAEIESLVSMLITAAAALWAWWKNNSFTKDHIDADAMVKHRRELRKAMESMQRGR